MATDIIQNYSIYYRNEENIKSYIIKKFKENNYFIDNERIEELIASIYTILNIIDTQIISFIIDEKLSVEFNEEIINKIDKLFND